MRKCISAIFFNFTTSTSRVLDYGITGQDGWERNIRKGGDKSVIKLKAMDENGGALLFLRILGLYCSEPN